MSKSEKSIKKKTKSEKPEAATKVAADTALGAVSKPSKEKKEKKDKEEKKDKKDKKDKKRKRDDNEPVEEETSKKSKKSKKQKDPKPAAETDQPATAPHEATAADANHKKVENGSETSKSTEDTSEKKSKKSKDSKKSKKAKKENGVAADEPNGTSGAGEDVVMQDAHDSMPVSEEANGPSKDAADITDTRAKKKSRKQRASAKRDAKQDEANRVEAEAEEEAGDEKTEEDAHSGKKNRFVVFVGNLPYSATKEQLQTHFAKIAPTDIRIMTDKVTKKPKGFAFVEFDRFDRMETCLKLYNHSVFADGKKGRKINVELTAGGGGNTEARKSKIQAKNEKLHEERQREREKRDEIESKRTERKAKKEAREKKNKKGGESENGAAKDEAAPETSGIHPARLAMMNAPTPKFNRQRY